MPRLRFDQYLSLGLVCLLLACVQSWSTPITNPVVAPSYALVAVSDVPVSDQSPVAIKTFADSLSAEAVYVMDVDAATPLLVKNPNDRRYPASTTKLLTALVSLQTYDLEHEFQVREEAFTLGTTMGLELGERVSVKNLLSGLLMNSGNDAAFVLANNYPGGYEQFVQAMNTLAAELHLSQTTFTNPSGLDQTGHQSSARDLAILAHEVMKKPVLRQIAGTVRKTMVSQSGEAIRELKSTNALLGVEPGVIGVKTGTTDLAGEVLITQTQRQGREVLIVVMGSADRYTDTKRILEWVFTQYQWLPAEKDGAVLMPPQRPPTSSAAATPIQ